MIFQKNHQNCFVTVEVYTNGHANSDGLQNMQAISLSHIFLLVREIVTLFWQNLSLFVPRYLTCKLGWQRVGYCKDSWILAAICIDGDGDRADSFSLLCSAYFIWSF